MKEELGPDHFEGRSWRGFHHHACLVMMAYGFLALEQRRLKRHPVEPGKKRLCSESRPKGPSDRVIAR
jgi:SRSO17 transposase